MATVAQKSGGDGSLNVILVGKDHLELGSVYDQLLKATGVRFVGEVISDVRNAFKSALHKKPNFIVVDDNLGRQDLKYFLTSLKKNEGTREIPVTIIQNSNRDDLPREGAEEFILKDGITTESITRSLMNSIRIARLQAYLRLTYKKQKRKFRVVR